MKLALLSYYTRDHEDYLKVADINVPAREAYCKRHGYDHVVHCGPYHDPSLYYAVARIYKVYDMLFRDPNPPDFVWVLNVQAVITNQGIPVHQYTDDEHDFWITKDCHVINAGSFIVRRSEWSRRWLQAVGEQGHRSGAPWFENRAIIDMWERPEWKPYIKVLPQNTINSYRMGLYPPWNSSTPGDWRAGDLVLSLPGLNLSQRLDIIKSVQSSIIT